MAHGNNKLIVGIPFGYWSTNIGNSFFQLGAETVLSKILPQGVVRLPDFAGYCHPGRSLEGRSFNSLTHKAPDVLILVGPFLTPHTMKILGPALERFTNRGGRIAAIGAGMMDYDLPADFLSQFFERFKFVFISTRDSDTFARLQPFMGPGGLHDGIDPAFFISDVAEEYGLTKQGMSATENKLLAMNLDQSSARAVLSLRAFEGSEVLDVAGSRIYARLPNLDGESIIRNHFMRVLRSFSVSHYALGDVSVVHTEHRFNPYFGRRIYSDRAVFSSDTPEGYLSIYHESDLLITSRVHACVAATALGTPSMFLSSSPRAALLERVGIDFSSGQRIEPSELGINSAKSIYIKELSGLINEKL